MDAYELHEARFVSTTYNVSAANALSITLAVVPEGRIWTVLSAEAFASVAETQDYWFMLRARNAGQYFPITWPREIAVDASVFKYACMLSEGMEIKLYPGERLAAFRDAATAGSTMSIYARYIETDLPLYDYIEPQEKLRISKFRRALVPGAVSPIGGGRPGGIGGGGVVGGGGGGVPRPK